jgi:cytochrome oxidase Cu insertion factor (SCO1/SenC/PrrC family)
MYLRRLIPICLVSLCFWAGSSDAQKGLKPGEKNTPPAPGERYKDTLKVGDPAPNFTLADPNGKNTITLSSYQGKKPVVLIFGSYT